MTNLDAIIDATRTFILQEFLQGEDPSALTDDVELFSSGILDSLATLKLITFLEESFKVTIEAHEADEENLNTLTSIANLVSSKL